MDSELLVDEEMEPDPELNRLTNDVLAAAIEVHRHLGPGHIEAVYEEALAIELTERKISFERQPQVDVYYKGRLVGYGRLDFIIGGRVIVELKAVDALAPIHTAQMISYLRITRHRLGLIINFNVRLLKDGIRRIAL